MACVVLATVHVGFALVPYVVAYMAEGNARLTHASACRFETPASVPGETDVDPLPVVGHLLLLF